MKTRCWKLPSLRARSRLGLLGVSCAGTLAMLLAGASRVVLAQPELIDSGELHHTAEDPRAALATLASQLEEALTSSRPLLLGSRDPNTSSCVNIMTTGQVQTEVPGNVGDYDGGPGTTIGMLYYYDRLRNKSPVADFNWHQTRFKTYLQNQSSSHRKVGELVNKFAQSAQRFSEEVNSWTSFPAGMAPIDFVRNTDWPSYCLASLDKSIRERDLSETRRWATELHAAAFALEDLHRWVVFLSENQLAALDFQRRCATLFTTVEALKRPYDPTQSISQFPAGVLCLNGISNYYEVERQAETLFATPKPQAAHSTSHPSFEVGSIYVMPELRKAYLDLRDVLSPHNRATWDLTAMLPYHHAYMVNMLFRSTRAGTVAEMRDALRKFDAIYPRATAGELMGALMYRGHSFAGLEWADRFQDELIAAADEISVVRSDAEALIAASRWTHKFYKPENYGSTLTLRDAIENEKLDCVRATDMIASILKNAGRTRLGHVRWSSENMGHSVAAYLGTDANNQPRTYVMDGLNPTDEPEVWPDAYFNGHEWPANLTHNPTPYAVELYGRGIDGYIWVEGYVIRGPNAGLLKAAGIPYFPSRMSSSTRRVFDGPYPQ